MKWTYRNQINNFLTAVSNNSEGEIWVYGDITSDKWSDDDVTPTSIRDALDSMGPVGTLNIRVNSYGGSVYAGNAIINIIDSYRRKNNVTVNAYIEGIAASMGSGIPMVADKIYMAENAMMMVHKPYTLVMGNADNLQKEIEILQKVEDTLVKNYMRHFNGTEEQLRDMLADETWLTADEALEYGLCDEIIEAVEVAASARGLVINGREFRHDADKIAAKFIPGTPIAKVEPTTPITQLTSQSENFNGFCNSISTSDNSVFQNGITWTNNPNAIINSPYLANINGYFENKEAKPKVFEYDAKLSEYGINEETFKSFNMEASAVLNILEKSSTEVNGLVIPFDEIKNYLGENISAASLIEFAKAGMEIDQHMSDKAKAYDKLVNSAIEDALKNGVRAKGENFNDTKWKKILAGLDYDEILDQSREWDEEARISLNAGKRVSKPYEPDGEENDNLVDPKLYDLFH